MIDITLDFETCALLPTAAVMSVAAVAWNRHGEETPFFGDQYHHEFFASVDIRGMFIDGFDFEKKTQDWWKEREEAAKELQTAHDECLYSIDIVISDLFRWINSVRSFHDNEDYYLWAQGTDFDIPILRNICHRYNMDFPLEHKHLRDHRTYYLEGAKFLCELAGDKFDERKAYAFVEDYKNGTPHSPLFDCKRSIYSTWQMMNHLKCCVIPNKR